MEELSFLIDHQNATMLLSQASDSRPDSKLATPPNRQLHKWETENPLSLEESQSQAGAAEKPINIFTSEMDDKDKSSPTNISFADDLDEYISEDSVLRRSIRQRTPDGLLINEHYASGCKIDRLSPSFLEDVRADSMALGGTALIIQDINQDWAQVLLSKFPMTVHSAFLAEHMTRIDSACATDGAIEQLRKDIAKGSSGTRLTYKITERRKTTEFEFPLRSSESSGLHLDILLETNKYSPIPSEIPFSDGPRRDIFEKDPSNHWRRASTRLSWCKLEENFYLILVDTLPGFDRELGWTALREHPFQVLLDPRSDASKFWTQARLAIQYSHWDRPTECMKSIVSQLLQHHTIPSVFAPKAVPVNGSIQDLKPQRHAPRSSFSPHFSEIHDPLRLLRSGWGNRQVFVWLLTESTWQVVVTTLEVKWQRVRLRVTKLAGDEAFVLLTGLRRQFADAQDLIAESRESCIQTIKETRQWRVDGQSVAAEEFWSGKPNVSTTVIFRDAQSMDIRHLPDSLEKMEQRVAILTRAVNQEIQVVIGSVQVEDAKTMKRQTEWMVVLALLAAIYLPMTLVTGIFGMNISEINADQSLPDRWSAVRAWGVVFGATIGCILLYAAGRRPVRWMLDRREIAKKKALDIEALKVE